MGWPLAICIIGSLWGSAYISVYVLNQRNWWNRIIQLEKDLNYLTRDVRKLEKPIAPEEK